MGSTMRKFSIAIFASFALLFNSACTANSDKLTLETGYQSDTELIFLSEGSGVFCRLDILFHDAALIEVLEKIWIEREKFGFFISGTGVRNDGKTYISAVSPELCSTEGRARANEALSVALGPINMTDKGVAPLKDTETYLSEQRDVEFNYETPKNFMRDSRCVVVRESAMSRNFPDVYIAPNNIPFIRYSVGVPLNAFFASQSQEVFVFDGRCENSEKFVEIIDHVLQLEI
ncbi:MAG: hypothetical protein ABJP48_03525 [Erythrobacter sp.]